MPTKRARAQPPDPTLRIPIEELARRTGFTVRNIRELQRRELVAGPELEGRKGFYNDSHLSRLALVRRMQDRGYSLSSIGELLREWEQGRGIDEVVGMGRDLLTPSDPPQKEMSQRDLFKLLPELRDNAALRKQAAKWELIVETDDQVVAPSAELAQLTRMFIDQGVPARALFTHMSEIHDDIEQMMGKAREMFVKHVFSTIQQRTSDPLEQVREASALVKKLRPSSVRMFHLMMTQAAERGGPAPTKRKPSKP